MEANTSHKNPIAIFNSSQEASAALAQVIATRIKEKNAKNETFVLGLATGATPVVLYKELIRLHQEEGLSFKNVVTFNLDEYYPMLKDDVQSYYHFMHHNLFNHIDLPVENINIPDGAIARDQRDQFCNKYEDKIAAMGGLDFQVLGIGRTGHVGFNEPGSEKESITRSVMLAPTTIQDAIKDFGSKELVPTEAITMGVSTILKAKEIALLAFGSSKAEIIKFAIEGSISSEVPATFLQNHPCAKYYLDVQAAAEISK